MPEYDTIKFEFDETDLEAAISQEIGAVNEKASNESNKRKEKDSQETVASTQSSQESLDGREELDAFFRKEQEREVNYLNPDEEDVDESEEGSGEDEGHLSEEDEDKTEESDKKSKEEDLEQGSGTDDQYIQDILDIIRQENLLYIPEDFDGELDADTLDFFKERTNEIRRQEILNDIRSQYASDPEKLEYFDYFVTGGDQADLPTYQNLNKRLQDYREFDVSDEENQKVILREFLTEGLDPENPAHRLRLNRVDKEVEELLNNYEGEEKAKEAKEYFVGKYDQMKQQEQQRVLQIQQERQKIEELERERQMQWHNEFRQTLDQREWDEQKKRAILEEQYGEVMTQDGQYVPVWWAKEMMIKSDPSLYQVYLDWLNNSFDLKSGAFKQDLNPNVNKEVTRKILELARKKQSAPKSHEQQRRTRSMGGQGEQVVDPLENL